MPTNTTRLIDLVQRLKERERLILAHVLHRTPVSRDTNEAFAERMTFGQRMADKVASFGGSWTFIFIFLGAMSVWMLLNVERAVRFDPYPFILLNLVLSCLAALQAPIIMMSQNRQAAKDRLAAQHDYEVNLKAELEIMALHAKMDDLGGQEWKKLLAVQERLLAAIEARSPTAQD